MAANQAEFLQRVEDETGFVFKVLTGFQEAYYDYLGVANAMAIDDALILDIGGGSTELIWMHKRQMVEAVSLPLGSVTLTERFADIKSKKKRIEACKNAIQEQLDQLSWLKDLKGKPIIGLGGVIRTLGKLDRGINGYSIENLHNYRLHESEVEKLCSLIIDSDEKDLDKLEGISKRRADIITMGIMPFKCLFELIGSPEIRISANGLREGYFYEKYFESIDMPIVVSDVLKHSKENFLKRFVVNEPHARKVQSIALKIYDQLNRYSIENKCDYFKVEDRKLLSTAALLHDIGIHIEYYDHHIHGFYLILNGRIDGLTNAERLAIAYLVGSHRELGIKNRMLEHENILSKNEINRLGKCVLLLNLAEQLDRTERGLIKEFKFEIGENTLNLTLISDEDVSIERVSALRLAERFEKQFDLTLNIM